MRKCSVNDLVNKFENSAENYSVQEEIGQGREGISLSKPLISSGFQQCSALILVNAHNGATFLKHVGPRPLEVFSGDRGIGEGFQDKYNVFMEASAGQKIVIFCVYGSYSYKRAHLISQVEKDAKAHGCTVEIVEPIFVPSLQSKWKILFDPRAMELHTCHYAPDENDKVKAVVVTHDTPKINVSTFTQESRDEIERRIMQSQMLSAIKSELKSCLERGKSEDVETVLREARETVGDLGVQQILNGELDDWGRQTPTQACEDIFACRYSTGGQASSEGVIRSVEILARHDRQDDETRQKYLTCFFNMAGRVKNNALLPDIAERSKVLISAMLDPDVARDCTKRAQFFLKS